MKWRKFLFLTALMFSSIFVSVHGFSKATVVSMCVDEHVMYVNGTQQEIDRGRGTKPVIISGRTLIPIRAVVEAYGGSVLWNGESREVSLIIDDTTVVLGIDRTVAYVNNVPKTLDVAPVVINERTMLPVRFIAESFNFGIAWDETNRVLTIITDTLDADEYEYIINNVPDYSGKAYVSLNNNTPMFKDYEIISGSFEYYSALDELGRCNVCMSGVSRQTMPEGERESISSVTPTGWINGKYDNISGGYLYNRCHLIGYQLTGENANERNLITGTRYLNIEGMLPFENSVDDYIDSTGNTVLYRATPVFLDNNLVAYGVLLEAYSVEDNGEGISFCVFCYNVQPGIVIDYSTGNHKNDFNTSSSKVYRTPTGKRYHYDASCGGVNSFLITIEEAESFGLTPCLKCAA